MGDRTGIEWTDATWNPVTGCTKVSTGCDNCYAEVLARRRLRDIYLYLPKCSDAVPVFVAQHEAVESIRDRHGNQR